MAFAIGGMTPGYRILLHRPCIHFPVALGHGPTSEQTIQTIIRNNFNKVNNELVLLDIISLFCQARPQNLEGLRFSTPP